jgi:predicted MFS family arabinose efflux permease
VRRRPLHALYVADSISLVGNAVAQLAIPWFVLVTTGSAAFTALAVFFNFVPAVLAAFFGGVVVDRLGFRTTSVVADLASAPAVAAIPLLQSTVGIELWQLMALVFLGALLDAPGATARQALFPDLVELAAVRMERASGIRGAIQQGSMLVGGPLGGVLVAGLGATTALCLNAASFVVSAAIVAGAVPRAERAVDAEPPGRFLADLAEGMRFIWGHRLIRAIVLTVLLTNFLDAPLPVVLPVLAREAYGSATDLGLMYGVLGGAGLVGSLAFSALGHRLSRRLTFVGCFAVLPLMYLALATLPPLPAALAAIAVGGVAAGPLNPLLLTVSAEVVPTRYGDGCSARQEPARGRRSPRNPDRRGPCRDDRSRRGAPRDRSVLPGCHGLRLLQRRVSRARPQAGTGRHGPDGGSLIERGQ